MLSGSEVCLICCLINLGNDGPLTRHEAPHCPEEHLEEDKLVTQVFFRPARSESWVVGRRFVQRCARLARIVVHHVFHERGAIGDDLGEDFGSLRMKEGWLVFLRTEDGNEKARKASPL